MTKQNHRSFERKEDSPNEVKDAIRGVMTAFEEFKSTNDTRLKEVEKKGAADVLFGEKLDRINRTLDSYEGIAAKVAKADTVAEEVKKLEDRFDQIETALKRLNTSNGPEKAKSRAEDWIRAAAAAHVQGLMNLRPEQQKLIQDIHNEFKALSVSTDSAGGYLAPVEYVREITKGITEISPVRSLVSVRSIGGKAIEIPRRTGQFAAQRVIEMGSKSETTGLAYGLDEINAPEAYALVDISQSLLEDSVFSLEQEVNGEAVEQFAKLEGGEFVTGTGIGQMEGILVNGSVLTTGTGGATITADGLLALKYGVKTGYWANASWVLNRDSLGKARLLKDTTGQYLWVPGLAQGRPNTIDGDAYTEVPDMPNQGSGAKPVAYGDFRRAYVMVDRITMDMIRDPYTQAAQGKIRYIFRKRVGGKLVLPEAIRALVCS